MKSTSTTSHISFTWPLQYTTRLLAHYTKILQDSFQGSLQDNMLDRFRTLAIFYKDLTEDNKPLKDPCRIPPRYDKDPGTLHEDPARILERILAGSSFFQEPHNNFYPSRIISCRGSWQDFGKILPGPLFNLWRWSSRIPENLARILTRVYVWLRVTGGCCGRGRGMRAAQPKTVCQWGW